MPPIFLILSILISIFWIYKTWNYSFDGDCYSQEKKTAWRKIWDCLWKPLVSSAVCLLFCIFIMWIVGHCLPIKKVPADSIKIYAMNDQFGGSGRFYLGFGSIQQGGYYYYYYQTEGGYKMGKINADNALIVESDDEVPRIQYFKNEFVNKDNKLWGTPPGNGECNCKIEEVTIYVPKNSVKQNISFDLQN